MIVEDDMDIQELLREYIMLSQAQEKKSMCEVCVNISQIPNYETNTHLFHSWNNKEWC